MNGGPVCKSIRCFQPASPFLRGRRRWVGAAVIGQAGCDGPRQTRRLHGRRRAARQPSGSARGAWLSFLTGLPSPAALARLDADRYPTPCPGEARHGFLAGMAARPENTTRAIPRACVMCARHGGGWRSNGARLDDTTVRVIWKTVGNQIRCSRPTPCGWLLRARS